MESQSAGLDKNAIRCGVGLHDAVIIQSTSLETMGAV
jgi:hypothetical protein